jgi:hypothetical protein
MEDKADSGAPCAPEDVAAIRARHAYELKVLAARFLVGLAGLTASLVLMFGGVLPPFDDDWHRLWAVVVGAFVVGPFVGAMCSSLDVTLYATILIVLPSVMLGAYIVSVPVVGAFVSSMYLGMCVKELMQ